MKRFIITSRLLFARLARGVRQNGRFAAATFMLAMAGLLAGPGVNAQTTLPLNGASGTSTYSSAVSTTGGLTINQIFGAEYLVIAGGGAGGEFRGGGGGAGGYRSSVTGELTGGGGAAESVIPLGAIYHPVVVGNGGQTSGANGADSSFADIVSVGGGGGRFLAIGVSASAGNSGGSGGGGGGSTVTAGAGGSRTASPVQGFAGGAGFQGGEPYNGGSGGGAGSAGAARTANSPNSTVGPAGGNGIASLITGASVTRAGGGSAGSWGGTGSTDFPPGEGGTGGGGKGGWDWTNGTLLNPTAGQNNTGSGGGGGKNTGPNPGAAGGSGIVIVRYAGSELIGLTTIGTGTITASSYTGNGTNGTSGQLYQVNSFAIDSSTTSGTFSFDMSGVDLNDRLGTTMTGTISGGGGLTYTGPGRLTLTANNTYAGATTVTGSGSILAFASQAASGSSSGITIAPGATLDVSGISGGFTLGSSEPAQSIGGRGTILGNLTFSGSSRLAFDQSGPLLVGSGAISFASGFGIGNISGLDENTPIGTYTLLNETTGGSINLANLANVGSGNPFNLGDGKSAYFQTGSLQVIVVPEPGSLVGLGLGLAALAVRGRRRDRR